MKKKKLYTTSMATAVVVASIVTPMASAATSEDIEKYYKSSTPSTPSVTTTAPSVTTPAPVSTKPLTESPVVYSVNEALAQINSATTIYDSVSVYGQMVNGNALLKDSFGKNTDELISNEDTVRRSALAKLMGIDVSDIDYWGNSKQNTLSPDLNYYTSINEMKKQSSYAINESRQTLIAYGIKTKNWQPYYWYDATQNPSHYEIVNGQVVKNKNYYAYQADYYISHLRQKAIDAQSNGTADEYKTANEIYERELKEVINGYNSAPGLAVYSVLLHSHLRNEKNYQVLPYDASFFNSKWNSPSVLEGKSIDGTNPFRTIMDGLKDGTLVGSLSGGYSTASTAQTNTSATTPTTATPNTSSTSTTSGNTTQPTKNSTADLEKAIENADQKETISLLEKILAKLKSFGN